MMKQMALAVAVLGIADIGSAQACSVGNPPATTAAKRVAGRDDLWSVKGTFRIDGVGKPDSIGTSVVSGRVITPSNKAYPVEYAINKIWVECVIYYLPTNDADGRFYLRRKRGGVFELVDWSGGYIEGGAVVGFPDEGS